MGAGGADADIHFANDLVLPQTLFFSVFREVRGE